MYLFVKELKVFRVGGKPVLRWLDLLVVKCGVRAKGLSPKEGSTSCSQDGPEGGLLLLRPEVTCASLRPDSAAVESMVTGVAFRVRVGPDHLLVNVVPHPTPTPEVGLRVKKEFG